MGVIYLNMHPDVQSSSSENRMSRMVLIIRILLELFICSCRLPQLVSFGVLLSLSAYECTLC